MAIQTINLGTYANDGTGDDLRTAFQKVNANFTELGASDVRNGVNLGPADITLTTTAASSAGGISTLTFAAQLAAPFSVGDSINVTGVIPLGFNGTHVVTECTTTSVSFAGTTSGPQQSGTSGTITSNIGNVFAQKNTNAQLEFKTLTSHNGTVVFSTRDNTIDVSANPKVNTDTTPELGGNLNLNNYYVYGGDVQTTVYGINLPITNSLVELMIAAGTFTIDFGTFLVPTGSKGASGDKGFNLDMGYFLNSFDQNNIDFGAFSNGA